MRFEREIATMLEVLNRSKLNLHSILVTADGETVYEEYRAPFTADTPHRMYSVTKSFVAVAIGCLMDEGKLALDDKIVSFFPDKQPETVTPEMSEQTIRNMLMMSTCSSGVNWFGPGITDRTACYFALKPDHPAGTLWHYDSTGSYILGALAERLSGMKLLDYLRLKVLDELGGFENARILEVPDGTAWGDSALICTTRALERFARFVMQKGEWNGRQLISRAYMEEATSPLISNNEDGTFSDGTAGYGYQIWMNRRDGFSFYGMGGQHAICLTKKKIVVAVTGDNQYDSAYRVDLYRAVTDAFLPDNGPHPSPKEMMFEEDGLYTHPMREKVDGAKFVCGENPMGIKWVRFDFDGDEGNFTYENAQGEKSLRFGFGKNVFGAFPQAGYSSDRGNVHEITDFRYQCAISAVWRAPAILFLRVQIVDDYLGSVMMSFGFRDENTLGIHMVKVAEDFLNEYNGWAGAKRA